MVAKGVTIRRRHILATAKLEKIGGLIVHRKEFLGLPPRFHPLHDPLSSPRRPREFFIPLYCSLCWPAGVSAIGGALDIVFEEFDR